MTFGAILGIHASAQTKSEPPDPYVQFDASDASTIFTDREATLPLGTTSPQTTIRHWKSKGSLPGMSLTMSTAYDTHATYVPDANRPDVEFKGTWYEVIGTFSIPRPLAASDQGATMIMVWKFPIDVPTDNGHFWNTAGREGVISIPYYEYEFQETFSTNPDWRLEYNSSPTSYKNVIMVYAVVGNTVTAKTGLYFNDPRTPVKTTGFSDRTFLYNAELRGWAASLYEFRIYDRALNTQELQTAFQELKMKWGLPSI